MSEVETATMELPCGHKGVIAWRRADGKVVGVKGTKQGCPVCMKRNNAGEWNPTIYLIDVKREGE